MELAEKKKKRSKGKGERDNDEVEDGNEEDEGVAVVANPNPVSFVGMNFCGASPLLPCAMTVWHTPQAAYEHLLAEHVAHRGGLFWCGWWGCGYSNTRRNKMEQHMQRHLVGEWRCGLCSVRTKKRTKKSVLCYGLFC